MGAPPAPPEPPTTAPTTTTTTLPTTTAAPTTTTTTIPPNIYFLKNDGTGDTRFQFFNALATDAPDNATLPNYDTDYDSVPGQRLLASSRGLGETDTKKIQTYAMDPNGGQLNGSTTATLWASTVNDTGGSPVALRAILRDCNAFLTGCTIIAEDTQNVSSTSMQSVTFDFGTTDYSFGDSRRLVLILLTEGSESLNIGFDADTTPSSMSLPL